MAKIYKITPVDQLPGRKATTQASIYTEALEDAIKSGSRFVKIEVSGRKPASVAAALKDTIGRDQRRYGRLVVHRRGDQVFVEQREATGRRGLQKKAA